MNPHVESNLALLLFLPWYAILGGLFWVYPRAPKRRGRRAFDAISLLLALGASVLAMRWAYFNADNQVSQIWRQVLASTLSYGAFLGVLALAWGLRRRWLV